MLKFDLRIALLTLTFVQLNLQLVLYSLLGLSLEAGDTHPALLTWILAPLFFLMAAFLQFFNKRSMNSTEASALLLLVVCLGHAVFITPSFGIYSGIFAFFSWAVWIGLFFSASRDASRDYPDLFLKLLVLGGVLNAGPVIYEAVTNTAIFKSVTLADVTRRYGINQSVSIMGMQLAVGVVATFYYLLRSTRKFWPLLFLGLQGAALILSTSRGPLLYLMGTLAFIGVFLPKSKNRQILITIGGGFIFLAGVLFLVTAPVALNGTSQLGFVLSALTMDDTGNSERLTYYAQAFDMLSSSGMILIFGYGAGSLSLLAARVGGSELGLESSAIKILLELGLLGAVPFYLVIITSLQRAAKLWYHRVDDRIPFLTGSLVIIVLQLTFHETLKAWIGAMYFWMLAAAILHIENTHGIVRRRISQEAGILFGRIRAASHE